MNYKGPMLTDSGGFQVFSLADSRHIKEEGVTFKSHLNGDTIFFSPEIVIGIEEKIGADIIMSGHMGNDQATVLNARVIAVDAAKNYILVSGGIPGSKLSIVMLRSAIKPLKHPVLIKPLLDRAKYEAEMAEKLAAQEALKEAKKAEEKAKADADKKALEEKKAAEQRAAEEAKKAEEAKAQEAAKATETPVTEAPKADDSDKK